jgi:F0F1-type ATP synthase membrane subunit a
MNTQLIIQITVVALVVIVFGLWLFWQIKKKGLKGFVTEIIIEAEDTFEEGKNSEKMNFVIDKVIALIPMPLSLFITRETVQDFIQKIFDSIKLALDYKK